jgi:hypothetical protein
MKIQKQAIWCIIFTLSIILLILVQKRCQNEGNGANAVYIRDTLVSVIWDTVRLDHYETVVLPLHDTLYMDSVRVDSVRVDVPIYSYKWDSVFTTDSTELDLSVRASGFAVTLDTLAYSFRYTPTATFNKGSRWGIFAGPVVGIGTNGRLCVGFGAGFGVKIGK